MKNYKLVLTLILVAALATSLVACMRNTEPEATVAPEITAVSTPTPSADYMPEATNDLANRAPFDWTTGASDIEAQINQLSEVSESRVIVDGTTVLVGIKFSSAYQGEMTERIREMVAQIVKNADPSATTIAVTSEPDDVEEIFGFADQITTGTNGNSLGEDIKRIVDKATTLR